MKRIKLFENFTEENTLSVEGVLKRKEYANDVIEDIKSISYILEDEGFELEYQFAIPHGDGPKPFVNYFKIRDYNRLTNDIVVTSQKELKVLMIHSVVVKLTGNTIINPNTFGNSLIEDKLKSVERYINLLKDHLDYINPDNISQGRTLGGNINIKIKL